MEASPLLSSVHGRIRTVLYTVPFWAVRYRHQPEIAPYVEVFHVLLGPDGPGEQRIVVTNRETESDLRAWVETLGTGDLTHVITVPDSLSFTLWAQDAALVRPGPRGPRLVAPAAFERFDDTRVLEAAARHLGLEIQRTPLRFQGGNVLVGDDFWLAGADAVAATCAAELAADWAAAEEALASALDPTRLLHVVGAEDPVPPPEDRPLAPPDAEGESWTEKTRFDVLPNSRQPVFDLDAFVSLCGRGADGRYRVLVGDPRLAAELTGSPLPDHAHPEVFDAVAAQLMALGFDVRRSPLPLVFYDDRPTRTRTWYHATSNNVIAEIDGDHRRVWVPSYGSEAYPDLRTTDAYHRHLWEDLGFDVRMLPDFHVFARGLGAAHCLHKCLEREESA